MPSSHWQLLGLGLPFFFTSALSSRNAAAEPPTSTPAAAATEAPVSEVPSEPAPAEIASARGTHVSFLSSDRVVQIYVAPVELPSRITRLGFTPINTTLAPGNYIVDVGGQNVTGATVEIHVGNEPQSVLIDPGSSNASMSGTLMACGGGVALFAGLVMAFGGTKETFDPGSNAAKLGLLIGGGVVAISGLVLTLTSTTSISSKHDGTSTTPAGPVPDQGAPTRTGFGPTLELSGSF